MAAPLNTNVREKILAAAMDLLQCYSFDDITLAKIAAAANISKGTLYYYYNSKDVILFDITQHCLSSLAQELEIWVNNKEKDTGARRLIKFILEKGAGAQFGNLRLYLVGAAVSGHDALRQKYIELYQKFKEDIAALLKERLPQKDSDHLSWLVLTAMDGILIQQQLNNNNFNSQEFIEKTTALICGE